MPVNRTPGNFPWNILVLARQTEESNRERPQQPIQSELGIPNSTLSHHLEKLKNEDLVKVRLVGDLQTELVHDFFDGFVHHASANFHAEVRYGRSNHHKIEAIFKCFARAMRYACSKDARLKDQLPSTKGLL